MSSNSRLTRAFNEAKHIAFDKDSKFILFSDCHRGDSSFADDFAKNKNIYYHALQQYNKEKFTYIELGDGDELWENRKFSRIFKAYKKTYLLLKEFNDDKRLECIWGNHDMDYRKPKNIRKNLHYYHDYVTNTEKELLINVPFSEAIVLKHKETQQELFLVHGHQADWFNFVCWKLSRFLVRVLWKPLQILGISDPTSPAQNYKETIKVESHVEDWIKENNNQLTIIGHTHRPRFPSPDEIPFFNDGSCVHPRSITGIEIENNHITLIKWHMISNENGTLQIIKSILEGPDYYQITYKRVSFCKSNIKNVAFYNAVNSIPNPIWDTELRNASLYLSKDYLFALENNHPEINFNYIIIYNNENRPIAFAAIQIVDFDLNSLEASFDGTFESLKCIARKLRIIPSEKVKLLICGNTFLSGEHGLFIGENQPKKEIIKQLVDAIHFAVNNDTSLKKTVKAFLIKDFEDDSLEITNELHDYQFYSINVEPTMVLEISKTWINFEDYLSAMKTKFRVKAKRAFTLSESLEVKPITIENFEVFLPKMNALYTTVAANAAFNLGNFNVATYKDFKRSFGENYILQAYCIGDKMVGFLSGLIHDEKLDAHFVGIDYEHNRTYGIYQRMLYDYIHIAIENKLQYVDFGRTASEIKSSVGAKPQQLTMYIRHKRSLANRIIKPLLQKIKPTPFQQKEPFKKEKTLVNK